ncbi:MAG: OmpA family protein [Acidobacteria bacterium]|nr:OmpA family protein [Acidobacteriota bacterium]MBV9476398.1 OmpA family protein [Acidobacteriota bacterium]
MVLILATIFAVACATTNDTSTSSSPNNNRKTKRGAAIGAVAGAIAGAVIGNQGGNNRTGAVVGAAVGTAVGAAVGHRMDKQEQELRQIEGVEVTRPSEGEIDVRLTSDILFDFNSADLRSASRTTLNDLASNFRQYPDNRINVEGHTDSVGTDEYNQRLSEQRAANVADYLIDQGVPSRNVVVYGYGESRPKATNDTAEGRQLNRRVEIHIQAPPAQ